jgi:hypothetical protein
MPEPVSLLMVEFLTWASSRRRTYAEAMEAWRSTCPRHTVWEDAFVDGLVQLEGEGPARELEVALTARGRALLETHLAQKSTPETPWPAPEQC